MTEQEEAALRKVAKAARELVDETADGWGRRSKILRQELADALDEASQCMSEGKDGR